MRIFAFAALFLFAIASLGVAQAPEAATVVYLVRHAETDPAGGRNPELTEAGRARAERLGAMLAEESIAAVYCTATLRSHATAQPLLERTGLTAQEYAPMDGAALKRRVLADHRGERSLVVAHSNTVNVLLQALGGPDIGELGHEEFDRLIIVVMTPDGGAHTIQLRY